METKSKLSEFKLNYREILSQIESTARNCGRDPKSIRLMLVTKTVPVERIQEAIDIGHELFGENKVQELTVKQIAFASNARANFHFIGHLQSNKVKKCIEHASMIQSVDRLSLAVEIDKHLQKAGRAMEVLIQVNTSNEASKFGAAPDQVLELVKEVSKLSTIKIKGLMTLAKFSSEESVVRPCFKILKNLSETIHDQNIPNVSMRELSMGMSSDYKIAIEEGATILRIGTAVFGKRILPDTYYWPEKN
ncbi:MAG: YggS family pyridoxal phosphate-dependent enzyme [Proteobacteria bacterium]|jgi:pyridoxal phosphate enzyme (YggS family)|nr:YggS family pyridoxal phosphate-dependent enzyme [Pseudomonadota bacterium]